MFLPIAEFAYNNANPLNIGYTLFKLNYDYHSRILYKKNNDFHFKLKSIYKLSAKLRELIIVS